MRGSSSNRPSACPSSARVMLDRRSPGTGNARIARGPPKLAIIKAALNDRLDDSKIGRDIEIAWHEKPVIANVQDLRPTIVARCRCVIRRAFYAG